MSKPTFTPAEAQALVNHARNAPLVDLAHAERVKTLLDRFAAWYNSTLPKPKSVKSVAEPAK
jgi:hypothetical protein